MPERSAFACMLQAIFHPNSGLVVLEDFGLRQIIAGYEYLLEIKAEQLLQVLVAHLSEPVTRTARSNADELLAFLAQPLDRLDRVLASREVAHRLIAGKE